MNEITEQIINQLKNVDSTPISVEKLKIHGKEILDEFKVTMNLKGTIEPHIFVFKGGHYTGFVFSTHDLEDKMEAAQMMKEISKHSDAMVMVFDSTLKIANKIEDIENQEPISAIHLSAYIKDITLLKVTTYVKGNGRFNFSEHEWTETKANKNNIFKNPYI